LSRDLSSIRPLEDAYVEPKRLNKCNWVLIYLFGSLGGFAAYAYAPCLPSIKSDLESDQFAVSTAVVANWVTRGIGSFVLGYLSDYTGRKWMIHIGLQLIILGSYLCSESTRILEFILTIMIQGFGEGASSLVFTLIAETHCNSDEEKYRHQGIMMTIQSFSLVIGPAIGGVITRSNNWRWVFRTIYIWAIVCMVLTCFLPETNQRQERRKTMYKVCDKFWHHLGRELSELCRREYISALIFFSLKFTIIYIFLSTLAFVFEDFYDMSSLESGLLISVIAGGALFGTVLSVWGLGEDGIPSTSHLSDLRWAFCFIGLPVAVGAWIVVVTQVYDTHGNGWIMATIIAMMMFFFNCVTLSYSAIQHRQFKDKYGTSIGFSSMFTLLTAVGVALPFILSYNDDPKLIIESITLMFNLLWLFFWVTMGIPGLPSGFWDDIEDRWEVAKTTSVAGKNNITRSYGAWEGSSATSGGIRSHRPEPNVAWDGAWEAGSIYSGGGRR